jgi:hypothetical protein
MIVLGRTVPIFHVAEKLCLMMDARRKQKKLRPYEQ